MHLLEYQGKALFSEAGIPIPIGEVVNSVEDAQTVFEKFSSGVAIKAQVHAGGRGRAGGVKLAYTEADVSQSARAILDLKIKGHIVKELLIEEIIDIEKEYYLSYIVNSASGTVSLMFSTAGGINIEDIAKNNPDDLLKLDIDDISLLREYEIRNFLRKANIRGKVLADVASIAYKLSQCFKKKDLMLAEINPLVVTKNEDVIAADAKVEVDNNSLYRHIEFETIPELIADVYEQRAKDIGISYVQMAGDIGIIASGAGLAMNSMDILESRGEKAANFLETRGGITAKLISDSVKLLLSNPLVRGILVNLYGGVNPMLEAAKGVIDGLNNNANNIPVVVKLLGNQQEAAWSILEEAGVSTVKTVSTERAVDLLLQKMKGMRMV